MSALAFLLGLAWLASGCAARADRNGLTIRQTPNLVFGPSIFGIGPGDALRAPWPVTDAPPESAYARIEIRDIQYGTDRPLDSYYRRFDSIYPARGNR
jgi:hypothetical protein